MQKSQVISNNFRLKKKSKINLNKYYLKVRLKKWRENKKKREENKKKLCNKKKKVNKLKIIIPNNLNKKRKIWMMNFMKYIILY